MNVHPHIEIMNETGECVKALAPMIVSASRATDIPAFYSPWLFDRICKGYCVWKNPYNGKLSYISFNNTHFIVFWTKNAAPLYPYLHLLKDRGINFYIQFTINDYEHEKLEPNVPNLTKRIDSFKRIVDTYGFGSAIWRFDPLILTDRIGIADLLGKINKTANALQGYTEKLVFSFADIDGYKKVGKNLQRAGIKYRVWTCKEMTEFAEGIHSLNLPMRLSTCAEHINLSHYGIEHNRCVDPELISRLAHDDHVLQMWLFNASKDNGQRKACNCILSKDIGQYNTCLHGCHYCYATNTPSISSQHH